MYEAWIKHIFDHPESEGDWRFSVDPIFSNQNEVVTLISSTFEKCKEDFSEYSNWQLNKGLYYIFSNNCSDYSFAMRDYPVAIELRLLSIASIKNLYASCFSQRCAPSLSHLGEEGNELNEICYMLWDITPLSYCEQTRDKEAIYKGILRVLEYALSLSNPACIESAIHGLGHMEPYCPEVKSIINKHLNYIKAKDARLYEYALLASEGRVQ